MVVSFLSLHNITKSTGLFRAKIRLLGPISLSINQSTTSALIGPSGAGKSLLARIIASLTIPSSGKLFYMGRSHQNKPVSDIQMVFQHPYSSLTPHLKIKDYFTHADSDSLYQYLELLELSPQILSAYPHHLSGGELQRVSLLRALVRKPKLLICDEFLSALEASLKEKILLQLLKLQKTDQFSLLWITHEIELAKEHCSKIYLMESGLITSIYEKGKWSNSRQFIEEIDRGIEWYSESK